MKWIGIIIIGCSLHWRTSAQLVFEKTSHDFGDIKAESERFVDIEVTNKGKKREYFLSFRKTDPVSCLANGQYIEPDSTLYIRLQPEIRSKGKFKYSVLVFLSDRPDPVQIEIKGNVLEMPENTQAALQACPDFNRRPPKKQTETKHELIVLDALTKQPITSRVYLIQHGLEVLSLQSGTKPKEIKAPLNLTLFHVAANEYVAADTLIFLGFESKKVIIYLKRRIEKQAIDAHKTDSLPPKENKLDLKEELLAEEGPKDSLSTKREPVSSSESTVFPSSEYKPVNVVFVLDVSGSMYESEKLILAKYALNQLVDILRPEDRIGVVTFATRSEVVFRASDQDDKESIKKKIAAMRANGSTAGVEGLRKGYHEVEQAYLPEGSNLLIVITDGAFELGAEGRSIVKKALEHQIPIAVAGIKSGTGDARKLNEIATGASGIFIPIDQLSDAQTALIDSIKAYCKR